MCFESPVPQQDWTVTLPFQEQDETDDTYETRDEAIDAAYAIAEGAGQRPRKIARAAELPAQAAQSRITLPL